MLCSGSKTQLNYSCFVETQFPRRHNTEELREVGFRYCFGCVPCTVLCPTQRQHNSNVSLFYLLFGVSLARRRNARPSVAARCALPVSALSVSSGRGYLIQPHGTPPDSKIRGFMNKFPFFPLTMPDARIQPSIKITPLAGEGAGEGIAAMIFVVVALSRRSINGFSVRSPTPRFPLYQLPYRASCFSATVRAWTTFVVLEDQPNPRTRVGGAAKVRSCKASIVSRLVLGYTCSNRFVG